jgi:hypothetical protein
VAVGHDVPLVVATVAAPLRNPSHNKPGKRGAEAGAPTVPATGPSPALLRRRLNDPASELQQADVGRQVEPFKELLRDRHTMPHRRMQQAAIPLTAGMVRLQDHSADVLSTVDGFPLSSATLQVAAELIHQPPELFRIVERP